MQTALDDFRASIARVRHLPIMHAHLVATFLPPPVAGLDIDDLLRSQVVMTVSALDYYVHELTRLGMIEVLEGKRPVIPPFEKYQVSLDAAKSGILAPGTSAWLDTEIRTKHGFLSFQKYDKIADAIRLFSAAALWTDVAAHLGVQPVDIKLELELLVQRRNKIAHEADLDPSFPGVRWPITAAQATRATDFVESICETIHLVIV
ncbi:MAG: HEPN domain-containing protein [Isosphaeraceae bacterium]